MRTRRTDYPGGQYSAVDWLRRRPEPDSPMEEVLTEGKKIVLTAPLTAMIDRAGHFIRVGVAPLATRARVG